MNGHPSIVEGCCAYTISPFHPQSQQYHLQRALVDLGKLFVRGIGGCPSTPTADEFTCSLHLTSLFDCIADF
jgi:hypothetical protein